MASIKKRGKGYLITVSLGRDVEDRKVFETITFIPEATTPKAIEKEVDDFAHEFEKRVRDGKYLSGEKMTYKDVAERWKANWAAAHLSDGGDNYFELIKRYAYPAFGMMKISKIQPAHVENIIKKMGDKGLSAATIRRAGAAVNSVFRYAYRLQIIQENPYSRVERPGLKKDSKPHSFTIKQAKTFLRVLQEPYTETIKSHDRVDDTGKTYHVKEYERVCTVPLQLQAYFTLAVYGGFRRGEQCALTWKDLDFDKKTATVNKSIARRKGGQIIKEPKTAAGNRVVPLPAACFTILERWKTEQKRQRLIHGTAWKGAADMEDAFVFTKEDGTAIDVSALRKRFRAIIERYNSNCEKEEDKLPVLRIHDLRHTTATILQAMGLDMVAIAYILGHSKPSTTFDMYAHPLPEKVSTAPDLMEKALSG